MVIWHDSTDVFQKILGSMTDPERSTSLSSNPIAVTFVSRASLYTCSLENPEKAARRRTRLPESIANPEGLHEGHSVEFVAVMESAFDVINPQTGVSKHYPAK
jgi:hypothetical protein